jgi:hypothetical protein
MHSKQRVGRALNHFERLSRLKLPPVISDHRSRNSENIPV